MSYLDNIEKEGIDSQFLCVLTPRRLMAGFTLFSGSVYSRSFDLGYVSKVEIDGVALALGSSSSLSAGQFYWDNDAKVLYVRASDSGNPNNKFTVVFYEIYIATFDKHWYRDPLDDTSEDAYYEPFIVRSPNVKITTSDSYFGYLPIQTSSIQISNADHIFEKHLYDSSFNQASIKIYHQVGSLKVENIRLIYDGVTSDVSYSGGEINLKTFNTIDELNQEFRNQENSFYSADLFPNVNPNFVGKPIRYVYGKVEGFVPVTIDYPADTENVTTSDLREWVCINEDVNIGSKITTVPASPSSTTTRTYLVSAAGFMVGDSVYINGTSDYYVTVKAVGPNYIEHDAIAAPANFGDFVSRSFVGNVTIIQQGQVFKPLFGRDYTETTTFAGNCSGFTFSTSLESNLSMPNTLNIGDQVFCTVYGPTNDTTLDGGSFGSNDTDSGNRTHPVVIIVDLLKRIRGISEDRINIDAFVDALSERSDALGIAIPDSATGGFPNVKTIVEQILANSLLKLYIDNNLKYSIKAVGPLTGSASNQIADDEILKAKFDYDFDYGDVYSSILVNYAKKELAEDSTSRERSVLVSNDYARYVHKVEKQKSFDSFHFKESDAIQYATRLAYIMGDHQGTVTLSAKNRFYLTDISDEIEIDRKKLPGFEFDGETIHSRNYSVIETQKSLNGIIIKLQDQRGIEQNSGDW